MLTLLTSITVFAKGDFSFISISGPKLKEPVRVTDPTLTGDFFAFADFFEDKTLAPADPGTGYEITRYYTEGNGEIAFDRLHYYPDTGFVYYDGIVNGSSEYDGEWYTAKHEIKTVFESALLKLTQSSASPSQPEPINSIAQVQASKSAAQPRAGVLVAASAALAVISLLGFRLRKMLIQ
jgi:hypothetical protein